VTRWQWYREAEERTISHAVAADRPPADRETHTAKAVESRWRRGWRLSRPSRPTTISIGSAFPPSRLKQAIGRKPHGQAVGPTAKRLAGVRGSWCGKSKPGGLGVCRALPWPVTPPARALRQAPSAMGALEALIPWRRRFPTPQPIVERQPLEPRTAGPRSSGVAAAAAAKGQPPSGVQETT
jgi:hypothetical protein